MPTKRCIKCDSDKLTAKDGDGKELVMPLDVEPSPEDVYFHCLDCGHDWNEKDSEEEAE